MPSPLFEMLGWRIHFCRFSTCSSMCSSMYVNTFFRSSDVIFVMSG